ncbi:MAG: filamentous hemagglutinin N-terminal domain-containing protein [Nitrospira sp.]|nr:filamentous hemagglutinin N-terminal domain-containing protein [Nitrospira sp.]
MVYIRPKSAIKLAQETALIASVVFCATVVAVSGRAETPMTPSGLGTQVELSPAPPAGSTQYDITGGTRAGANLFHSFGVFDVPTNTVANFLNDSGLATSNILGRVTGGTASSILGTIQTTGFGDANLFLMNPSGIVFGPSASLNVGGSVTFTTANYMRLGENNGQAGIFYANPASASVLTSSPIAAFGFLDSSPSAIDVQGSSLTTQPGRSISLIGGDLTIKSGSMVTNPTQPIQSNAAAGQINLASVASPGEILATTLASAPNTNGQSFEERGTIRVLDQSVVDASGSGGGTVLIRGGKFLLDDSKVLANVTAPGPVTQGVESVGGGIDIAVSQDATIQNGALIGISVADGTTPGITYGGVKLTGDRIIFLGIPGSALNFDDLIFTKINTNTVGGGHAGNVTLQATSNIELTNVVELSSYSGITATGSGPSATLAQGHAGNVELTSLHGDILMRNGGRATQVASQLGNSTGNTGRVTVSAPDGNIVLDGASLVTTSFDGSGRIGSVEVTGKNLLMKAGLIGNENLGPLKPGGITITLSNALTMEADFTVPAPIPSQSLIVTSAFHPSSTAPAGDITITAKNISATQGSLISSETYSSGPGGQLQIFTDTLQLAAGSQIKSGSTFAPPFGRLPQGTIPTGNGGDITVQSNVVGPSTSVLIDGPDSGIFSDAKGTGAGGNIFVNAKSLSLQNGSTLSAAASGTASSATGGSIIVNSTDQVTLTNGASITANSTGPTAGNAGDIMVNAGQQLDVTNSSSITTATESPLANGGNIDIRAIDRIRIVNSTISTSVLGAEGNGGNIFIDPKVVVLQGSEVTAKAVGGAGGNITFVTPLFLTDSASLVSASSERGPSGTVTIQSPTSNLSGAVGQLTAKTSPPQVLLQNRCVAKSSSQQSSFILAGRDALPANPGGWLSSPVAIEHWTGEDVEEHASGLMVRRIKPNQSSALLASMSEGEVLSLRGLTPPGFLVRTFATGLIGCTS